MPIKGFLIERGDNQIRTGDQGVADPRLTAWLCRHQYIIYHTDIIYARFFSM